MNQQPAAATPVPTHPLNPRQAPPSKPRKKGGCGCLTSCLIVLVILLVLGVGGGLFAFFKVRNTVTDVKPEELSEVQLTEADRADMQKKAKMVGEAVDQDEFITIGFTAKDLNALIKEEMAPEMQDRVMVNLADELLNLEFSIPLDGIPGCKGRFLNGSAAFDVRAENGILDVYAREVTLKGDALPGWFMKDFRSENLAGKIYENPNIRDLMKHIKQIRIENGILFISTTGEQENP